MAVANTAHSGEMGLESTPQAKPSSRGISIGCAKSSVEDETSLTSTSTDSFEQDSSQSEEHWGSDADGILQRHGSSESATSTGVSSICSSIAAEEKRSASGTTNIRYNKRMSDGTLKRSNLPSTGNPVASSNSDLPKATALHTDSGQSTVPKRRGRPPKDKSAPSGFTGRERRASIISKLQDHVRPRSSLPNIPKNVFAAECLNAAYASRLDPYALHPGEHEVLVDKLMNKEVTVYLNIRNAILRLWLQNPICAVTVEEAAGCAKEGRFFGLAEVAYKWLVRNGYINFGCVEVPRDQTALPKNGRQKTVVVIGAGVAGLTTARQLDNLVAQSSEKWIELGERPPRVLVLEARKRIGGRVYSRPLRTQVAGSLPGGLRNTVEMGAMIVTGFEHGNPLNAVIRGQLGLPYHLMTDELTIYDHDGRPVDRHTDMINTELYTDISDRAGEYRATPQQVSTLRGSEELIDRARDPLADGFENFLVEPLFPVEHSKQRGLVLKRGRRRNAPPGTEKLTGRSRVIEESDATLSAARAAKTMGWQLKHGVAKNQSVSLHKAARSSAHPTLGAVMDEAIEQYQDLIDLTPQDMRLLNWHHANLEYANAAPVSRLSLSGHDQDTGNEFEGAHSEIIGGYSQMPLGLSTVPTKLDIRFEQVVESIHYNAEGDESLTSKVVCANGEVIEADEIVISAPLGVLKSDMIDFDPPLPSWKEGAIDRMGFGLLNKLVLLYDKPFWDDNRDMFGLLNEAEVKDSLDPADYARNRGRFYLVWNASKISGRPMLVALMAGYAAHEAERTDTNTLLGEINMRLRKTFGEQNVPAPIEVIVTRWKRDPFTRGTYSYVAPETRPGDYDLMAQPVGNLHFAGEATCGTHPATVHGAFLSGLRAAADVMESLVGSVTLPSPLVGPPTIKAEQRANGAYVHQEARATADTRTWPAVPDSGESPAEMSAQTDDQDVIKQEEDTIVLATLPPPLYSSARATKATGPPRQSVCASDNSFWVQPATSHPGEVNVEAAVTSTILAQIGERPMKPKRPGVNPFLLYTKAKWEECRRFCDADPAASGRDAIRQTLGKWWRALSEEEKRPYVEESVAAQEAADEVRQEWETQTQQWDLDAKRIRREYLASHPPIVKALVSAGAGGYGEVMGLSKRKTNVSNCVVLDRA